MCHCTYYLALGPLGNRRSSDGTFSHMCDVENCSCKCLCVNSDESSPERQQRLLAHNTDSAHAVIQLQKLKACKHAVIKAAVFWSQRPGPRLFFVLAHLEAHEGLMKQMLFHGSNDYEHEQEGIAANAQACGEHRVRSFAILEFAMLTAESNCIDKYRKYMMHDDVWNCLLAPHERTAYMRCFGFRLIGSGECHIAATLMKEARCMPTAAFLATSCLLVRPYKKNIDQCVGHNLLGHETYELWTKGHAMLQIRSFCCCVNRGCGGQESLRRSAMKRCK